MTVKVASSPTLGKNNYTMSAIQLVGLACLLLFQGLCLGDDCEGLLKVGDLHVRREELIKTNKEKIIADIVVDPSNGDLYFSQYHPGSNDQNELNVLRSGSKKYEPIAAEDGNNPQAVGVDEDLNLIIVGTNNGFGRISKKTGKVEIIRERGSDIVNVNIRNKVVYATLYPGFRVFRYSKQNGDHKREELNIGYADGVVADSQQNVYYINPSRRAMKLPHGQSQGVPVIGLPDINVSSLAIDREDHLYIALLDNSVFLLKKGENKPKLIFDASGQVTAMFFDQSDALYAAEGDKIFKYTNVNC